MPRPNLPYFQTRLILFWKPVLSTFKGCGHSAQYLHSSLCKKSGKKFHRTVYTHDRLPLLVVGVMSGGKIVFFNPSGHNGTTKFPFTRLISAMHVLQVPPHNHFYFKRLTFCPKTGGRRYINQPVGTNIGTGH